MNSKLSKMVDRSDNLSVMGKWSDSGGVEEEDGMHARVVMADSAVTMCVAAGEDD